MLKIFTGANGYYIAGERDDGFHYQPQDNGSRLGWNLAAAEAELRRRNADAAYRDAEDRLRRLREQYRKCRDAADPTTRSYLDHVYPLAESPYEDADWHRIAIGVAKEGCDANGNPPSVR